MTSRSSGLPLALGLAAGLVPLIFGLVPGDEPERLSRLIWGYGLSTLPFIGVLLTWRRLPEGRRGFWWLIGTAALVRVLLLMLPPLLSEDVWRYVWDGAVQWAGQNPYVYAPVDSALDWIVAERPALAEVRAAIGHSHIPTIYPPAAQVAFAATAGWWPHQGVVRFLMVVADLVAIGVLWQWLHRLDLDPRRAAWLAFAPVAVLEGAVGGHVDALGAAGLVVACGCLPTRRVQAGIGLMVGIGTKLLPVVLLPWMLLRRHWLASAVAVVSMVAISVPYFLAGDHLLQGLTAYGHHWRGNDGAFAAMMAPLHDWLASLVPEGKPLDLPLEVVKVARALVGGEHDGPPTHIWPDELAFATVKAFVAGVVGLIGLERLWRARTIESFAGPVLTAVMLLSPVVHPWYLLWIMPLAIVGIAQGRRWPWAVVVWGLTVWLAYVPRPAYLETGEWAVASWISWAEYLPPWGILIGLAASGVIARGGRRRAT
ncbi:MAG: glycosyltransferase family 87 protein [Bradymonadia bacterium]